MSIAAYVRISTSGQNEVSQQRQSIQRWLDGHDLEARWYVDTSTGDNLDRPAYDELQEAIFHGEIDTVVVFKLDRLSRSLRDGVVTLHDWLGRGVRLISTTQGHDFSGGTGKLIAAVLFSVAEMEQTTRRERQAEGIAAAKARGVYQTRRTRGTKAKPQRAQQLRKKGLRDHEIAEAMGVSRRTVQRYLTTVSP